MHDACRQGQLSLFYTLYAAKNDLNIANTVSVHRERYVTVSVHRERYVHHVTVCYPMSMHTFHQYTSYSTYMYV